MAERDALVRYLNERLDVAAFDDKSINGLQVEGAREVERVALATDAALSVYRKAAAASCQLIVAHHGLIWGGLRSVTGRDYQHIKLLLDHEINLYAAHLPLDAHGELGNNAELSRIAGIVEREPFGDYHGDVLGFSGRLPDPLSLDELAGRLGGAVGGATLALPFGPDPVRTVAFVSGRGTSTLGEAIAKRVDCLVTGEGVHEDHHQALEGGVSVLYLGHYHSETLGVRAVGAELEERFGIETVFIDEPTILG